MHLFYCYLLFRIVFRDLRWFMIKHVIFHAVSWFTLILIFVLSAVLSYQCMSLVSVYEEAGPLSSSIWEISPLFFWGGRIIGTAGSLSVWFLFLRKVLIRQSEMRISLYVLRVLTIALACFVFWFASTVAVFLSTGFIDIQPKWADNAFIVNFPVYIFGISAAVDTVLTGIRRA